LQGAKLWGADLHEAKLRDANLQGASLPDYKNCPETGSFEAWKKVRNNDGTTEIVKLLIPANAKRTSLLISRKCRAEFAIVLEGEGYLLNDKECRYYKAGEI
jgi:hypothetical protein